MNFPHVKHALTAVLALGGTFAGLTAHADVFTAGTGNGELTLFVRNETTGVVYARGLGAANRVDNVATQALIQADVGYTPVPQPTPETLPTTYTFANLGPDANLTSFLSGAGVKTWTIMGGDSVQDEENAVGDVRFLSTIPASQNITQSTQATNGLLNSAFVAIDSLNITSNSVLGGAAGSGDSVPTGGLYGTAGGDGETAKDWFGSTVSTVNNLGSAAGFYLHTTAGGAGLDFARVYQIGTFTLDANGNLSFASASSTPAVPLPAAAWLLLSGLASVGAFGRRKLAVAKA